MWLRTRCPRCGGEAVGRPVLRVWCIDCGYNIPPLDCHDLVARRRRPGVRLRAMRRRPGVGQPLQTGRSLSAGGAPAARRSSH
jgi:hypothetical protein